MATIIYAGSVHDITNTLRNCEEKTSVDELKSEIKAEKKGKNRKSVISLLQAAINRKKGRKVARSSSTGKFVTKEFAKTHKDTTEEEKIK